MCLDVGEKEKDNEAGAAKAKRLRVGVAGLGVIGEGAALELSTVGGPYEFCAALVRDASKPRENIAGDTSLHTDADEFLDTGLDAVLDALPDGEAGYALIKKALSRGISVVSANKQAVAGNLEELHALAARNGASFFYSASVGGGAPMVETVREAREAGAVRTITAILNGTVNYILTEVARGGSFEDAVKAAQDAGFAEPDPTADLSGEDARAKIAILGYEAFDREIDLGAITLEPLDAARADALASQGGIWKQLARLEERGGELAASVSFGRVDDDGFFSGVTGEGNALHVVTAEGKGLTCKGKGAGRAPTVASLFADLERVRQLSLTGLSALR